MEESEKMVALKKAYAEIILNTAKEAAARIMVSERKALRFEQDLCSTKDDAVRMLVRLKKMIDSKTIEAENTSLTQQRRIEELEAQLQEAEGVIIDLRTELNWVQDKLEKVMDNQVQPLNGEIVKEDASSIKNAMPEPITPSPSDSGIETVATSDMKNTPANQRLVDNKCYNAIKRTDQSSISHLENCYAQNSDLNSVIVRTKEPELYRNGCTQRIRALERNLLDGQLHPGDEDDQHSLMKNELIIETGDKDEGKCIVPSGKTNSMDIMKNCSFKEVKKPVKVRTSRRRKSRFGKAKATSCRSRPSQLMKPCQPSILSHCKSSSVNRSIKSDEGAHTLPSVNADNEEMIKNFSGLAEKLHHKSSCYKDDFMIINKGKRKRKMQSRNDIATSFKSPPDQVTPCQPSSVLTRCNTYSYSFNGNVKSNDQSKISENEAKMKPLLFLDPGLTLIKRDMDPISGSKNVTVSIKALNKCGFVQNAVGNDPEFIDESELAKQEGDAAMNSTVSCSELNPEMVNVPLMYSDLNDAKASEETIGSPSRADDNRLLKYTFQRKRKKESLSSPDENTSEKSTVKRRAGEKQNGAPEPQKSSLANESSRDSRRLAQVARQLISLSGKRWW